MADRESKTPGNVPGKYYVDVQCIFCGLCWETAPENFEAGDPYAHVKKQPETPEEEERCQEALENCPVAAIGDDGEE